MKSPASELQFLEEFLLPLTRSVRSGADLGLASVALDYERETEIRLAELRGQAPLRLAAARRDPAVTGRDPFFCAPAVGEQPIDKEKRA